MWTSFLLAHRREETQATGHRFGTFERFDADPVHARQLESLEQHQSQFDESD